MPGKTRKQPVFSKTGGHATGRPRALRERSACAARSRIWRRKRMLPRRAEESAALQAPVVDGTSIGAAAQTPLVLVPGRRLLRPSTTAQRPRRLTSADERRVDGCSCVPAGLACARSPHGRFDANVRACSVLGSRLRSCEPEQSWPPLRLDQEWLRGDSLRRAIACAGAYAGTEIAACGCRQYGSQRSRGHVGRHRRRARNPRSHHASAGDRRQSRVASILSPRKCACRRSRPVGGDCPAAVHASALVVAAGYCQRQGAAAA
jgi:hypothetical protein